MTSGPATSGRAAASIITAQPPWQLPTIAGFWLVGVPLGDDADEFGFGVGDVGERLPGHRVREKDDEVDRVARGQCDADLGVLLEAADARDPCPARGSTMTNGRLASSTVTPLGGNDAHERMVGAGRTPRASAIISYLYLRTGGLPAASCSSHWLPRRRSVSQYRTERCAASHRVLGPLAPELERGRGCGGGRELGAGGTHALGVALARSAHPAAAASWRPSARCGSSDRWCG